jgi:monolysocardiolipin acyltransferase
MVLEAEPCPDVVPIFVAGFEDVMPEERTFPTFLPRVGKSIQVRFGGRLERGELEKYRERWRRLRDKFGGKAGDALVVEENEELMNGKEARQLRTELARFLRGKVEKLRIEAGETPEGDVKMGTAEYWAKPTVTEKETWT